MSNHADIKLKQSQLFSMWNRAINTHSFRQKDITMDDLMRVLPCARERAFQRLIQALLRERLLDSRHLVIQENQAYIDLPKKTGRIRFQYLRRYTMETWHLSGAIYVESETIKNCEILFPSELLSYLTALLEPVPDQASIVRLSAELDDSFQNDTLCLAFHNKWSEQLIQQAKDAGVKSILEWLRSETMVPNPSCLLEQWGTLGHPWHPNYKAKLSMSTEDVIHYSPEFGALITVNAAALHREVVHCETLHCESMTPQKDFMLWWEEHFPGTLQNWSSALQEKGVNPAEYIFIPVHPIQYQTLKTDFAKELSEKKLILTDESAFTGWPGMSFRTLWTGDDAGNPMIKLPVALHLTSVQRTITPRSIRMGPRISQLLEHIIQREPHLSEIWDFLPERYGVHYSPTPPDDDRARHLGIICRDNPLSRIHAGELAIPVGSLFATDNENTPLLFEWIRLAKGTDDADAVLQFFLQYVSIVVSSLLELYLVYGIAFEAHQQNSFMIMDRNGQPARLLVRDFGDVRIHRATLQGQSLHLALHDANKTLFDDVNFVRDKLIHAVFMCHLGEIGLLCERHCPDIKSHDIWSGMAKIIMDHFDAVRHRVIPQRWQDERTAILMAPWPAKAFVKMRLAQTQTDFTGQLLNPLSRFVHDLC